jgi:transglutaminase-like putative cysteine protease
MLPRSLKTLTTYVGCREVNVQIEPVPTVQEEHFDYYGNRVLSFAIESLHRELTVAVTSDVTITQLADAKTLSPAWETVRDLVADGSDNRWLQAQEFCYNSRRIARDDTFAAYAHKSFPLGQPIIESVADLTRRIHEDFRYDSSATNVNTSTEDAFELKAGVCQDFAHVNSTSRCG